MERAVEPLTQQAMHLFIKAAEEMDDQVKALTALLAICTGVRANTLCHIHYTWFTEDEGKLYIRIPNSFPCLKYDNEEQCGDCRNRKSEGYTPKTESGGGRRIKIMESWRNHYTDDSEKQPISLRDLVEHYFKMDEDDQGHEMLGGDGISITTANTYVKEVASEAEIGFYRKPGYTTHPRLGRVPDIYVHDLRGTFCVQLMRNDANPFKAIQKTGHKDVDSLKPYIKFAEQEFDGDFEEEFF
jgi:hypothetical protein